MVFDIFQEPKEGGEEGDEGAEGKMEEEKDEEKIIDQDVLGAMYECLGRAWPKESQQTLGNGH